MFSNTLCIVYELGVVFEDFASFQAYMDGDTRAKLLTSDIMSRAVDNAVDGEVNFGARVYDEYV